MLDKNYFKKILNGIGKGDKIGGPFNLASILSKDISKQKMFCIKSIRNSYLNWWENGAFDTGPTFASVFSKIQNGMKFDKAVLETHKQLNQNTAGCGPAHRASPIAGFMYIKNDRLIELARDEAKITHYHEDAGNGSAIIILLCRYLLEGKNLNDAQELISKNNELKESWGKVQNAQLKPDGYIYNVIHSALYFVRENKSLDDAIKFSGKANYCSVLVGAIMACLKK